MHLSIDFILERVMALDVSALVRHIGVGRGGGGGGQAPP